MSNSMSEMTLEELWELVPIQLKEHQACWTNQYREEKDHLIRILPDTVKIHHIGSTSIEGIWAKPIIDILMEADLREFEKIKHLLEHNDYTCMAQDETHIHFNKGYTPNEFAEKMFHVHLKNYGDNDELYFRDYLNGHPEIAKEYEKLKVSLWKRYEHDRDGYAESKTAFVREYTQKAKMQFGRRY